MKYDLGRAAIEARQCQDLLSQVNINDLTVPSFTYKVLLILILFLTG